jgi:5-methylcytosine-specific restriction enzyme subunit McrC
MLVIHSGKENHFLDALINLESAAFQEQPTNSNITKVWAFGLEKNRLLSYYVGLDWLDEQRGVAIRVNPKIEGLDFSAMLDECLDSPVSAPFVGDCYDVRADCTFLPAIDDDNTFLYFLVRHYLVLLADLLRKPLKKDYIYREENLHSKMKGKVLLNAHISKNIMSMRSDRVMCRYQEFSADCRENRLLHSAFRFAMKKLSFWGRNDKKSLHLQQIYDGLEVHFSSIGLIKELREVHGIKSNPLYKEYGEALRLARLLFRVQGYEESHGDKHLVPPYIVDMPKLFELYVFQRLHSFKRNQISFQSKGRYGYTDFLDFEEKIVIDTKYKDSYAVEYQIDDIRQVSGYARDIGILDKLGISVPDREQVVRCLIIYPLVGASLLTEQTYSMWQDIKEFHKIYKLGIGLPMKPVT